MKTTANPRKGRKNLYLQVVMAVIAVALLTYHSTLYAAGTVQLNFLYIHGVKGCNSDRLNAENSLNELADAIKAELPARIQAYQNANPGVTVVTRHVLANLYTADPSGFHPSDSTNPLNMDDWEVGDPGCTTTVQGQPCTTAYEWRYRLKREIETHFPSTAKNIILIGHSTGARVAMEVAANVGPNGVGTMNWGVQSKIAGVVTVQGMLGRLNDSTYNVVGPASFVTTCKNGDPIVGFGSGCALGNGWCEYAGLLSGFPAADWVSNNKRALMLISYASCSPSLWAGYSDGPLPFDAQGSALAVGTSMTAAPGKTFRPAHGTQYGSFCHSAIVDPGKAGHAEAVAAARTRILNWIFTSAPRVDARATVSTSTSLAINTSESFAIGNGCDGTQIDAGLRVVGVCKHPGLFDGDDHPVASGEITARTAGNCTGMFTWTQKHDSSNKHAATFFWKTYSQPPAKSLMSTLPLD